MIIMLWLVEHQMPKVLIRHITNEWKWPPTSLYAGLPGSPAFSLILYHYMSYLYARVLAKIPLLAKGSWAPQINWPFSVFLVGLLVAIKKLWPTLPEGMFLTLNILPLWKLKWKQVTKIWSAWCSENVNQILSIVLGQNGKNNKCMPTFYSLVYIWNILAQNDTLEILSCEKCLYTYFSQGKISSVSFWAKIFQI